MRVGSHGAPDPRQPDRAYSRAAGDYSLQRRVLAGVRSHSRVSVTPPVTWEQAPEWACASAWSTSAAWAVEQA